MRHSPQPLFARPTRKRTPETPICGPQIKKLNFFSKSAMISLPESTIKKISFFSIQWHFDDSGICFQKMTYDHMMVEFTAAYQILPHDSFRCKTRLPKTRQFQQSLRVFPLLQGYLDNNNNKTPKSKSSPL